MTDRTQGILNRASEAEKFSGVRWILGDGVITNYMQSFVDETMKRNAEFQSRAGVSPKIVRKSPTKCCPWCDALVGTYKYPDDVPDDVYRRHDNCNCIVEFYPGDGKKQNVWSKQWDSAEVLEERKRVAPRRATAAQLEERKKVGLETPKTMAEYSEPMQMFKERLAKSKRKVAYREPKPLKKPLTDDEIIERIAGGDMTKGSCSSAALAFIGNKSGLDVLDFRGGASQVLFSNRYTVAEIAQLPGVKSKIVASNDYLGAAHELMDTMESGKLYYMATGSHAAIIRRANGGFEFLELQSRYKTWEDVEASNLPERIKKRMTPNGFLPLDDDVLEHRFGCDDRGYSFIRKPDNVIIDIESLYGNEEFNEMLGYLNTASGKQSKGMSGSAK